MMCKSRCYFKNAFTLNRSDQLTVASLNDTFGNFRGNCNFNIFWQDLKKKLGHEFFAVKNDYKWKIL